MSQMSTSSVVAVGFDGSPQARDALALGADIARVTEARLAVIVVYPTDFLLDLNLDEYHDTLRRDAEGKLAEARDLLDGVDAELHTRVARTDARGLHDSAESIGAELLVVGSSHRSGPSRIVLGSVGTRLLHGAPCAVAVAPSGYASSDARGLHVILAGFDGSPESRAAVAEAARLADKANAALRIVAVAGGASVGSAIAIAWATYDVMQADERRFLEGELDTLLGELPAGLRAETHVVTGNPGLLIAEEAAKGADLVVVGSRGYGAVRRVMLGSVSAELLRTSSCPVLVVPRGASEPGREPTAVTAAGADTAQ